MNKDLHDTVFIFTQWPMLIANQISLFAQFLQTFVLLLQSVKLNNIKFVGVSRGLGNSFRFTYYL